MNISELKNFVIVVTSDEPYSKMWHTQLIYTEFLSKSHTVFYINPPKKWSPTNIFKTSLKGYIVNKNLTVFNYINKLPVSLNLFNAWNERYNEKKVANELKKIGSKKVLVWHFDSYRSSFSHHFFNPTLVLKRIYHVIDPFYKNPIDRWLCKVVDLLIVTSFRNNIYYTDFEDKLINVSQSLDIDLQRDLINGKATVFPKTTTSYFVLLGTLSDDIDFDWLLDFLKNDDFKIIVIGKIISMSKTEEKSKLFFSHANVEYLGVLSPAEFYPILKNAHAGLIVYSEERRARVCSPLKALNYIICDLPVITNIDCEIVELLDSCIYYCETIDQANYLVSCVLTKDVSFDRAMRDAYLSKISMDIVSQNIIAKL